MASIFTVETPGAPNVSDSTQYSLGVEWSSDVDGTWTGIRVYTPTTQPSAGYQVVAYAVTSPTTGTEIARGSATWASGGAWQTIPFVIPAAIVAGAHYVAAYVTPDFFVLTVNGLAAGVVNGDLTAFASDSAGAFNGRIHVGGDAFPEVESGNKANYFADPIVSFSTDVPVVLAGEADAALSLGRRKTRLVPLSAETSAALSLGCRKSRQLGIAAETGAARPIARLKQRVLGLAAESDLGLPVTHTSSGRVVIRPNAGFVIRPNAGTVTRP